MNNTQKKDMDQIERPWTPEEDKILQHLAAVFGMDWLLISMSLPGRTVKSCWSWCISLCWTFTPEEDEMLENLIQKHGLNWSLICKSMPGKPGMSCMTSWSNLLTPKGISLSLKRKSSAMTDEDKTIDAHKILPESFSNIGITQGSSYIHDRNLSHEVGGVSGKAPSIGDMARSNMSSGGIHSD
nr:hypothetical protein [Tanacetum cinerariifolium]